MFMPKPTPSRYTGADVARMSEVAKVAAELGIRDLACFDLVRAAGRPLGVLSSVETEQIIGLVRLARMVVDTRQ